MGWVLKVADGTTFIVVVTSDQIRRVEFVSVDVVLLQP